MDIGKAFTYVFEDDEWYQHLGIGGLISMVPVLNFAAIGYELEVARQVANGTPRPLPAWNDVGRYFTQGLVLSLARLVYALPFILLSFLFMAGLFGAIIMVPDLPREQGQTLFVIITLSVFLFVGVVLILGLLLGLLFPAITINYLQVGTFRSCFDFKAFIAFIRQYPREYLTAYVLYLVAGFIATTVSAGVGLFVSWIPCLGTLAYYAILGASVFWMMMVNGYFVGQLIRIANITLPATPVAPNLPSASIHPDVNSGR